MGRPRKSTAEPVTLAQQVGERVRLLRVARGDMTQEALATEAGFSPAYASRVEVGLQNLSLRTIGRIALALKVPIAALFEGVEPDPATLVNRGYGARAHGDVETEAPSARSTKPRVTVVRLPVSKSKSAKVPATTPST